VLFARRFCFSVNLPDVFLNYGCLNFCDMETLLINQPFLSSSKLINQLRLNRKSWPNDICCYSYVLRIIKNERHFEP
jgi:hypothetical protein